MSRTRRADRPDRLAGVDAARGLALLGMMAVHVFPARSEDGGAHLAHLVAGGRSAALFALLAGVGIALGTGGTRPLRGVARARWSLALVLRGVLVGLLGLLLADLEAGVAVILAYYAVLFVVSLPLLGLGPRRLVACALTVALVAPFLSSALRQDLPRAPSDSPTLGTLLEDPVGLLRVLLLSGYYPVLGWTAYLCAGLAVGRLALRSRRTTSWLLLSGTALACAATAGSTLLLGPLGGYDAIGAADGTPADEVDRPRFGTVPTTTRWWLATDAPHTTTPPDLLHTTGTALAVLGLALLVVPALPRLLAPLVAAGSMPLTLYCAHLVVLAAAGGAGGPAQPLPLWAGQSAAALLLAWLWRRHVGRGPLEGLLARLTAAVRGRSWNCDPPPAPVAATSAGQRARPDPEVEDAGSAGGAAPPT